MVVAYTTTKLLSSIDRKSFSPANQNTFTTAEILEMATEILEGEFWPRIVNMGEEHFVQVTDVNIQEGVTKIPVPARAYGVREILELNSDNNVVRNIYKNRFESIRDFGSGPVDSFFMQDNAIILNRTPTSTANKIRVYFYLTPSLLVAESQGAVITAIDTGTNTLTVGSVPSGWATGNDFDFLRKAGNHEPVAIDQTSTNVSGTTLQFSSLPSDLAVGDYINLAGEASLVTLPRAFRNALTSWVAAEILLNQSQPGGKGLAERAQKALETAVKVSTPRIAGEPDIITPEWDYY